jgi:hypothetical protein
MLSRRKNIGRAVPNFVPNHYAGHGPATVEMFSDLWRKQVATEAGKRNQMTLQGQLFK